MINLKGQTVTIEPFAVPKNVVGDGVLTVNKPTGWTSHDVVAKIRSLLDGAKVGHAGTLDPAATGVLPVLVGRGTRIAEYLLDWDKEYRAVLRLGETTDTLDATGTVLSRSSTDGLTAERIRETVGRFVGTCRQIPPMYSAVKVAGVPLYKSARAGRTVAREAREVQVYELEVLGIYGSDVDLRVVCSKGTYVRTLCADVGEALGVGGHLRSLERRRVGPLELERALTVEEIEARVTVGLLAEHLLSLDQALQSLPALIVDQPTAARVLHGVPVPVQGMVEWEGSGRPGGVVARRPVRVKDQKGRLLAIGVLPGNPLGGIPSNAPAGPVPIAKVLVSEDLVSEERKQHV